MSIDTSTAPPRTEPVNGHAVATADPHTVPVPAQAEGSEGRHWFARKNRPSPASASNAKEPKRKSLRDRREVAADVGIDFTFYLIFLSGALYGQVQVYTGLFNLPEWLAWPVSAALELAGVKFARDGAKQRAAGETGFAPLLLAYAAAATVIGVNAFGHIMLGDQPGAIIFGLLSALAFLSFTIRNEFKKRQADRESGRRAYTTPRYGFRWITNFRLVLLARELAGEDDQLGLFGSLEAAEAQIEAQRAEDLAVQRREKLLELLTQNAKEKYRAYPLLADIEVNSHDPERIARILMERADNEQVASDIIGRMEAEQARVAKDREASAAAEFAASLAPNNGPNGKPNGSRKLGRIRGRKDAESDAESRPNGTPNNAPNSGLATGSNTVPNKSESGSEFVPGMGNTMTLPRVGGGDENKRQAMQWIANELAAGRDPSGTEIERKWNVGTEASKGGIGLSLKRKVKAGIEKELSQQ